MISSTQGRGGRSLRLTAIGVLALGVMVAIYVYGRYLNNNVVYQPSYSFTLFGMTNPLVQKSLLATIALGLAVVQVLLALWIYRKLPLAGAPPRPVPITHRVVGFVLFAVTVPIAIHCMFTYGVPGLTSHSPYGGPSPNIRILVHSIAGCFFYGAFVAKVLFVQSRRLPKWVLPVAGGTLAITIGVLWYTSALWYYNGLQLPHV